MPHPQMLKCGVNYKLHSEKWHLFEGRLKVHDLHL